MKKTNNPNSNPREKMNRKYRTVRIKTDIYESLQTLASIRDQSMNELVHDVLERLAPEMLLQAPKALQKPCIKPPWLDPL